MAGFLPRFLGREQIIARPGFNRWLIPPCALATHLCIGQAYALSVFNLPLTRQLGVAKSIAGDWRLTQLKLAPVFGNFEETESGYKQLKPHPLSWLVEILNGVEHANFFEQRATEYSKGASKGSWDGDGGVWASFDKRNQLAAE